MLLPAVVFASGSLLFAWRCLRFLEDRSYWTVRLKIALYYEQVVAPYLLLLLLSVFQFWRNDFSSWLNEDLLWRPVIAFLFLSMTAFSLYHLAESRDYRRLRWKAWSGPSRTGIPSQYLNFVGDRDDWLALSTLVTRPELHPVEKYASLVSPFIRGILADPTELLRKGESAEQRDMNAWTPRHKSNANLYEPIQDDLSGSLLWGRHLGFCLRCSRGVISVPRSLLITSPRSTDGLDTRPISLACAILARNKGLEPSTMICHLESKNTFRAFEEGSNFWPRPAKTRRSQYRDIFYRMFSLLGEQYVTAATELALLISDIPYNVLEDWLNGTMEQQDIDLNHKAAQNGASPAELARLYRGQYAAMLVSLSLHRIGGRLRPEILIYEAACNFEESTLSPWTQTSDISERREEELLCFGNSVQDLVAAIV